MIPKPKYRRLLKAVKEELQRQGDAPFVAITKGQFTIGLKVKLPNGHEQYITSREVDEAWPHISKALDLIDDGTGTDTWTLPGRGFPKNGHV